MKNSNLNWIKIQNFVELEWTSCRNNGIARNIEIKRPHLPTQGRHVVTWRQVWAADWHNNRRCWGSCRKWKMDHHQRLTLSSFSFSFNWILPPKKNSHPIQWASRHVRTPPVGDSFNRQMTGVVRVVIRLPLWRRIFSLFRHFFRFNVWRRLGFEWNKKMRTAAHHFLVATPLASRIQIFSELSVRRTCSWHGCMVFLKLKKKKRKIIKKHARH